MSDFDFGAGQPGRIASTPKIGQPKVEWIRPHAPRYAPRQMLKSTGQERSERTNAMIVIVLTLACTAMAIVDLFLLASGS
jgi:hypothetical protein